MTYYNSSLTLKLYFLAALIFGTYGGRVCPMLASLTPIEVLAQTACVFVVMYVLRHFVLIHHRWSQALLFARLDTSLFFVGSLPLAIYYNLQYDFTIDSNLKVLFGMTLFGFFTGLLLQLEARTKQFDTLSSENTYPLELTGQRQSIVKQLIVMMIILIGALTIMLTMVAVKDIFWLEHNPERLLDGSGKISIIKEFTYLALVLGGYVVAILLLWSKLMKKVLLCQERKLQLVTQGDISQRLPVFEHNELGAMASLTNKMLDSLKSAQDEVQTTRDVAIVSLAALAESRDNETGAHIIRTQEYVRALATFLAQSPQHQSLLTAKYIDLLYKSAPLHDVGKVGIPDSVLLKPGKLTDEEFAIMKGHPQIGADALSIAEKRMGSSSFLRVAKEISLTHHEKWDGSGYSNQLSGEEIPLSGRLMALADVYDALISKRVYKPSFSHEKAREIILEGRGKHFDPQVVDAFLAVEQDFCAIAACYKDGQD
ncbi:HD domain-containing phosphohydrolase [Vibrio navarrensis]|uniref:HD domain-containing phosphohydrolase n=1 Tax=Vibrio navarrensis TaxID=29495 RepID=UPI00051D1372|nr:HD domain-containing phosphohydrolase [Vibrio navarrensis]KGK19908.1 metal-dependent phosphohydrolase [Vibrio navarrensis]